MNSKHQHPPRATPRVFHSTAAPGPGFMLDDLPQGAGFCKSIKLRLVQWKSILSLNWHYTHFACLLKKLNQISLKFCWTIFWTIFLYCACSHTCKIRSIKEALHKSMLTAKAFQDTRHKLLTAKEQCSMKINYLQKISRACLYSYLIRYQIIRHVAFTKPFVPVFNHYIYRICYPSLS